MQTFLGQFLKGVEDSLRLCLENSFFLIFGAVAALIASNFRPDVYQDLQQYELFHNSWIGHAHYNSSGNFTGRTFTLHFLINELLMSIFFAIAGKEVWEATLPEGPLNNIKQAAFPLITTLGGMAGPIGIYLLVSHLTGSYSDLRQGWAVPTATDIAFSYLVAKKIFGSAHPAIPFLLLLAIADDALGLIIMAVFYPQGPIDLVYLLMPVGCIFTGYFVFQKKLKIQNFWFYLLILGPISWFGFHWANLHPALSLLPIIPTMPHAASDLGVCATQEKHRTDTLNEFEHTLKNFVEIILGFFGLFNAGVMFTEVGEATWAVLAGLLVGKPLGIMCMGCLASKSGLKLPNGMNMKDLLVLGIVAGIGFTVSIFVASVAFPAGAIQDAAKIGALGSFSAAGIALLIAPKLGIKKQEGHSNNASVVAQQHEHSLPQVLSIPRQRRCDPQSASTKRSR